MPLQIDDLVVGVLYGDKSSLSANYKMVDAHYPVYCGTEFWERLTGDRNFYYELSKAFGKVVEEEDIDGSKLIYAKIKELAEEIVAKGSL